MNNKEAARMKIFTCAWEKKNCCLTYVELEKIRVGYNLSKRVFYNMIQDMETNGDLRAIKLTQNIGSQKNVRNVDRVRGVVVPRSQFTVTKHITQPSEKQSSRMSPL